MDWLNFGEGVAAGSAAELMAVIAIFLATRYASPTGPRTVTMSRGRHRAFIDMATNHQERWLWRIIDKPSYRQVANGEADTELLAIEAALKLINQLSQDAR